MNPNLLRDTSLKRKLSVIVMATTTAALIVTSLAFLGYELVRYRAALVRNLSSLAEIVGSNTTAALAFNDPQSAIETLRGLTAETHIVFACISTPKGKTFATYARAGEDHNPKCTPARDGYYFSSQYLELVQPILLKGTRIGTIYFKSTLRELYSRLLEYAGIFGLVMIASSFVAFMLSSQLQRLVSEPILQLAKTAKAVSQEKNYAVRAKKSGKDEIGSLIDSFNEMLAQIQQRDDALQKARDGLETRVHERTEQLRREVTERVRYAAELEKALQVKAEFLSVMSHELRTPINVIMGYTKVLHEEILGAVSQEQAKALATISRCSNDLLVLINDIMITTKLEADKVEVEWTEFRPVELLDELRSIYDISVKDGVVLRWEYPRELPIMTSDPTKIKQILQNLITNAFKFTDAGTVTVTAECLERDGISTPIRYEVTDTGIGIPPEMQSLIFEMFRQVDSTVTRSYGGVGLGLYIVKKFTEFLGGTVTVQSEVGHGSTFAVSFPLTPRGYDVAVKDESITETVIRQKTHYF